MGDAINNGPFMRQAVWLMFTEKGFYPIQPTIFCKPEDHGKLNNHITKIEDGRGNVLWQRPTP
jgi:hypothetical protein